MFLDHKTHDFTSKDDEKQRFHLKKNRDLINKDVMIQAANLCGFQPTWGFKHQRFIRGLTNKTRDLS